VKIAVCVKAVPSAATGARLDPQTFRLDRGGDLVLSEYDTHAVEEALRLRGDDGEVVLVSLGPERAADALRKALAMGADRAVLISDSTFEGADLLVTAKALAGALAREQAELILFGQQSPDGNGACLWAALAERLQLPVLSQAAELGVEEGAVRVKRQTEVGYETLRAPLPAVVAVSEAINEPRYPSLKGIMGAKSKPLDRITPGDLGLDGAGGGTAGQSITGVEPAPQRAAGSVVKDDGEGYRRIADFLAEKKVI